jgi:negative regulator of replication initiation
MDELVDFLSRVKRADVPLPVDEAKTRQAIVLPILRRLGWDIENTEEVIPEYATRSRNVDFCLCCGKEKVFLEVKKPAEELGKHEEQLLRYLLLEAIDLAVLTNGKTWSFYLTGNGGRPSPGKAYTLDLLREEPADAARVLGDLLARENVHAGTALSAAELLLKGAEREEEVRLALPQAWEHLISRRDEFLVRVLNDAVEELVGCRAEPRVVVEFLAALSAPPPRASAGADRRAAARGIGVPSAPRKLVECLHKRPKALEFHDARVAVRSWSDLLVQLAGLIYALHPDNFSRCLDLRGTKRAYFSEGAPDPSMHGPQPVPGSPYYVETYFSARETMSMCSELLIHFGYDLSDLHIETY